MTYDNFNSYDEYSEWSSNYDSDNAANKWAEQRKREQSFGKAVDEARNGEIINE